MAQPLEADSDASHSDYESTLAGSDTTSLLSAVKEHKYENGRRYHSWREGTYHIPNQNRMDIYHHVFLLLLGGQLYRAPLAKGMHKVLDLGTGTGIWVIDFSDLHPSAEVIGNDLSPIQPQWVPPNAKFEIDDIEDQWTHPKDSFDFIHGRMLVGVVRDWPKLLKQAFDALKPGGWIEFKNLGDAFACDDSTLPADSPHIMRELVRNWDDACSKAGIPWLSATKDGNFKRMLADAGFEDIEEEQYKIPNAPWPKDKKLKLVGAYNQIHLTDGISSLVVGLFTRLLGWEKGRVDKFVEDMKTALQDKRIHSYQDIYVTYARKPMDRSPSRSP